jgi:hypothetical protein
VLDKSDIGPQPRPPDEALDFAVGLTWSALLFAVCYSIPINVIPGKSSD